MPKKPNLPIQANYDVGYGKPPTGRRFEKGQSGNPKGRPKGSKNRPDTNLINLRDMVLSEATREVTIQDKTGPISMPVAQAAIRSLALKAAQGTVSAQKLLLESISFAEEHRTKERDDLIVTMIDYKHRRTSQIAYHKEHGIALKDTMYMPDPDHIEIDIHAGTVTFKGPMDDKEKNEWDWLWRLRDEHYQEIQNLKKIIEKSDPESPMYSFDIKELEASNYMINAIEATLITRFNLDLRDVVKEFSRRDQVQGFIDHAAKRRKFPKPSKLSGICK